RPVAVRTGRPVRVLAREPPRRGGVRGQVLGAGAGDDVGAVVAAAAADRPGDDDVPAILPASELRTTGRRVPVATDGAGVAGGGDEVRARARVGGVRAGGVREPVPVARVGGRPTGPVAGRLGRPADAAGSEEVIDRDPCWQAEGLRQRSPG